jgi:hypothetical protein
MITFSDILFGLIFTFIFGGIVNSLISDFVLAIRIDKRMMTNFINGLVFYCLMYYIETKTDKLQTLPPIQNTTV